MAFIDTTELDDAYSLVLPFVPGAPDRTALEHLRDKAIEFCSRTLAWQQTLATVSTVASTANYSIPVPEDSALVKVLKWNIDGRGEWVTPAYGRDLRDNNCSGDVAWTEDRTTFNVYPTPTEAGKVMTLTVALKPTREANEIPSFLYEHHIRAIADGAIGTISAMKQPWQDLQQAAFYLDRFENAVAKAASAISRGNGRTRDRRVVGTFY